MLGARAFGERASVLERAVQDPDGSDVARRGGASRRERPSARRRRRRRRGRRPLRARRRRATRRARRRRRAPRRAPVSCRTRRPARDAAWNRPVRAGPAAPSASARRSASRTWAWIWVSPRTIESRPRGDAEQVFRGVVVPVGVEGLRELVDVDASGFGEQALQREEPGMEARDVAVDLDAVAGRQDHGLVDALEVLEATVRLRQVVVGEREPLQQLDRRATERDPEGEDGHGRPIS